MRAIACLKIILIAVVLLENQCESIEVLDAALDVRAIHHADRHHEPLTPSTVEEAVLNVRRRTFASGICDMR